MSIRALYEVMNHKRSLSIPTHSPGQRRPMEAAFVRARCVHVINNYETIVRVKQIDSIKSRWKNTILDEAAYCTALLAKLRRIIQCRGHATQCAGLWFVVLSQDG